MKNKKTISKYKPIHLKHRLKTNYGLKIKTSYITINKQTLKTKFLTNQDTIFRKIKASFI